MTRFYTNHIGYDLIGDARALVDVTDKAIAKVELVTAAGWTVRAELPVGKSETTFRGRTLASVDLSGVPEGRYVLRHDGESSAPFWIERDLLGKRTLSAILEYFRSQRCAGPWNEADKTMPFFGGREGTVDVSGGYYDASGDVSKYLSHLSYANFFNPQQTPLVVWALLEYAERLGSHEPGILERLRDEIAHGADFLVRMQDPAGYFYMTVFDQWSKFTERRVICAYRTQKGVLESGYESGYRQGGGLAIAALARAGRFLGKPAYTSIARKGFEHLEENNVRYLDDGKENVIDDYCALLAAAELAFASGEAAPREAAKRRAASLLARVNEDGSLRADDGTRPYFHASDAGLPVFSLLRYAEIFPKDAKAPIEAAEKVLRFELTLTNEVDNPWRLARQLTIDAHGKVRRAFFIPHENETGYWWQGENARLGSLAAAAARLASVTENSHFRHELLAHAHAQLHWICGRNPFDSCMLHGFGHDNRNYMELWPNVPGGIMNGITAGFYDENDVDFGRTDIEGDHSWRWYEQWIPHSSWFLVALAQLRTHAQ